MFLKKLELNQSESFNELFSLINKNLYQSKQAIAKNTINIWSSLDKKSSAILIFFICQTQSWIISILFYPILC